MHTEYFHRWMDLLVGQLEPGERVLAQGRAFEPPDALRFDLSTVISGPGCAVAVTERGALWVSRDDQRWVRSLPFALVAFYTEITQAHRYALALDHQRIERLQWAPAHQLLWWSWAPPRRSDLSPAACWRLAVATPRRRERLGVGYRRLASRPGSHARCRSTDGPVRCRLRS
jgi:hypothetical protein